MPNQNFMPPFPFLPQQDSVRNFFTREAPKQKNFVLRWYPLILCSSVISTFVSAVQELLKAGVSEGFLVRVVITVLLAYILKLWVNNRELQHALRHRPTEMDQLEVENEVLTRIVDRIDPKTLAKQTGFMVTPKEPLISDIPPELNKAAKKEIKKKVRQDS